jgi:hypothetical protein
MTNTIITVATMKGGGGKSTVASCLAAYWASRRSPSDPHRYRSAAFDYTADLIHGVPLSVSIQSQATANADGSDRQQEPPGCDGSIVSLHCKLH